MVQTSGGIWLFRPDPMWARWLTGAWLAGPRVEVVWTGRMVCSNRHPIGVDQCAS